MLEHELSIDTVRAIKELARRYLWWDAIAKDGHSLDRMIAQIMHLGTYDDIRTLESLVNPDALATVMRGSAAGWFDDRSWDFWRGPASPSTA